MYTSSGFMYSKVPETELDYDEPRLYEDDDLEQMVAQETKAWNPFRDIPTPKESGSMVSTEWVDRSVKILKLLAYLVVFAVVLGSACVAKGCLLFITSQLKKDRKISHCNNGLVKDQQFITTHALEERVTWQWAALLVYAIPELGIFLRSCKIRYFKSVTKPNILQFAVPLFTETLHTSGVGLLMFFILPELDVVKGGMLMNAMCFVPGIFKALTRARNKSTYYLTLCCDILAVSAQATAFVVWPLLNGTKVLWWIPVASVCISIGWWENFVEDSDKQQSGLAIFRNSLKRTRYYTYSIIPIWNIIVFMVFLVLSSHYQGDEAFSFFTHTLEAFGQRTYVVQEVQIIIEDSYDGMIDYITTGNTLNVPAVWTSSLWVALIQIGAAYVCYVGAKVACKILIQGFSFSLALTLVGPVLINILMLVCGMKNADPCAFHNTIPDYLFFNIPPVYFLRDYVGREMAWVWILWLVSQGWVCMHAWRPRCERLASSDKLFAKPWYSGPLIDQSLLMNRTRDNDVELSKDADDSEVNENDGRKVSFKDVPDSINDQSNFADKISRIYVCATMWHETRDEIMEFLKSIFRLDKHQCARRIAFETFKVFDPDYYELEAHIFMDDAFEVSDHSVEDLQVNRFVKCLVDTIDDALGEIYKEEISLRPPKKYPTPYGGRLVWTMPGRNKLICHLKDKSKIRHRKRWSQVMYMYYFLGHRLMDSNKSLESLALRAENTYLLALDGDIDFKPSAVMLLIDLMKKDKKVGAACGRIHPVGSGFMAWYQMFEYAIGHWLQKATEHQIGCVLCSPGCFSLFRGKALMEDNVMKRYTLTSHEARHYVQYDQGEDRWLCTLLLQRGYRVEYSAASDAYTHCPERFDEFFNQRRRWVPSTIANIFDLLSDYKRTVRVNDNISTIYIVYQMLLMAGTVLGPGTIFLMMIGAMNAITGISNAYALMLNLIPIAVFIIVCMTRKSEDQLLLANIITCAYAMVMMMVIVGIVLQIIEDGWLAPSSIFTVLTFGSFFITAVLHPQEIICLFYIVVYYITIPSMYMLLIIYSLCNLNNVSWGTRETVQKKTQAEIKAEEKAEMEAKKKVDNQSMLRMFGKSEETEGSMECGVSGLFRCMCCTNPKDHKEDLQLFKIAHTLDTLEKKLDSLAATTTSPLATTTSRSVALPTLHEEDAIQQTITGSIKEERDDLINPYWIEDPDLRKGEVDFLTTAESEFWKELIDTYLKPIDENKEELARITADLKTLRDTVVFAFVMLNALFVLVIFLLQLNQDVLHLKWPLGQRNTIEYDNDLNIVNLEIDYLMLEPIGSMFLIFFGSVLLIQFTAMLFHRLGTLMHLLSNVTLDCYCLKTPKELTTEEMLWTEAVKVVEHVQEMNPDSRDTGLDESDITKRKTIMKLFESRDTNKAADFYLDTNFTRVMENNEAQVVKRLSTVMGVGAQARRLTFAMQNRRESVAEERRRSQMIPGGSPTANGLFDGSRPSMSGFASRRRSTAAHLTQSYAPVSYGSND